MTPSGKPADQTTVLMKIPEEEREKFWPSLPFAEWKETAATLHMWTQIIGKIRLTQTAGGARSSYGHVRLPISTTR